MNLMSQLRSAALLLLVLVVVSVHSILFFNRWSSCVDVSVERNFFPLSLIQSSDYHQVCPSSDEHWRRFGALPFRMHIMRTSEPRVDKYIELQHSGYVHFHNETRFTVAKVYGAAHEDL